MLLSQKGRSWMKAKPTGSHYREMADFRALKTSKQRREVVTLSSECSRIAGVKSIAVRWGDMTPQILLQGNITTGYSLCYNN